MRDITYQIIIYEVVMLIIAYFLISISNFTASEFLFYFSVVIPSGIISIIILLVVPYKYRTEIIKSNTISVFFSFFIFNILFYRWYVKVPAVSISDSRFLLHGADTLINSANITGILLFYFMFAIFTIYEIWRINNGFEKRTNQNS